MARRLTTPVRSTSLPPTPHKSNDGGGMAFVAGAGEVNVFSTPSVTAEDNNDEDKDNMAQGTEDESGVVPSLFHLFSSPQPRRVKGTKTFANGDIYEGELLNGIMDGQGTYKYNEGAVYIGQLKNGMRDGYGKYQSVNGEHYIGYFVVAINATVREPRSI